MKATGLRKRRVVITGLGWNTSLGCGVAASWTRLLNGESGIQPIEFWDPSEYKVRIAAVATHVPHDTGLPYIPGQSARRSVRLFVPAATEAFHDAGLPIAGVDPSRIGLGVGMSVNYLDHRLFGTWFNAWQNETDTVSLTQLLRPATRTPEIFLRQSGDTLQSTAARLLNLRGPSFVTDTACAASAHAIGNAYRMILRGTADAMVAGGTAGLVSPIAILAFSLLGALSKSNDPAQSSRPFDKLRDGFVMGEGAGAVVLECAESATSRNARIYAELVGFGSTSSGGSLTDPSVDGVAEASAMSQVLSEGKIRPEDVDYIAAHGTSTQKNDSHETVAIKRTFGDHARKLVISSNKGQLGHTISAAGVCNVICSVLAITQGRVPPTMNLSHPDPECDLDYSPNNCREREVRVALANAFAFGGQNAVLALRAWDPR